MAAAGGAVVVLTPKDRRSVLRADRMVLVEESFRFSWHGLNTTTAATTNFLKPHCCES